MLPALAGDGLWAVRGPLELSKGAPLLLWSQQRPPTPAPSKSWADGREAWASAECAAGKGCAHWPAQRHLRSSAWLSGRPFPLVFLWETWVSNRDVQQWARERVSSGVVCVRTRVRRSACQQSLVGPLPAEPCGASASAGHSQAARAVVSLLRGLWLCSVFQHLCTG